MRRQVSATRGMISLSVALKDDGVHLQGWARMRNKAGNEDRD